MQDTESGVSPPGFVVEIPQTGIYTLWLRTKTLYEGQNYEHEKYLPEGGVIQIVDLISSSPVKIFPVKSKRSFQGEKAVSIGDFQILKDRQKLKIEGSGLTKPVVLGIAPNRKSESLRLLFLLMGTVCVTFLSACVILGLLLNGRKKGGEARLKS